jgi:hypothetical protein
VRATVAHDSYERLVEVECRPGEHKAHAVRSDLYKLPDVIESAQHLGIDTDRLADAWHAMQGLPSSAASILSDAFKKWRQPATTHASEES